MTDQEYDMLDHDWETLKAKYISGKAFSEIEEDFLAFCELGYYYALSLYAPLYRIGENKKIDAIIDSFPDMSMRDIALAWTFRTGEAKTLANRAYVKLTRKKKGAYKGLTKSSGFDLGAYSNAVAEFGGQTMVSDLMYAHLLDDYFNNDAERSDIRLLSAIVIRLRKNRSLDQLGINAVESIANRPYSDYFENYRLSRQSNDESGE